MEPCWHVFDMAALAGSACIKLAASVCVCLCKCVSRHDSRNVDTAWGQSYVIWGRVKRVFCPFPVFKLSKWPWNAASHLRVAANELNEKQPSMLSTFRQSWPYWFYHCLSLRGNILRAAPELLALHRQHFLTRFVCFDFKAPKLMPVGLIEINFQPWN